MQDVLQALLLPEVLAEQVLLLEDAPDKGRRQQIPVHHEAVQALVLRPEGDDLGGRRNPCLGILHKERKLHVSRHDVLLQDLQPEVCGWHWRRGHGEACGAGSGARGAHGGSGGTAGKGAAPREDLRDSARQVGVVAGARQAHGQLRAEPLLERLVGEGQEVQHQQPAPDGAAHAPDLGAPADGGVAAAPDVRHKDRAQHRDHVLDHDVDEGEAPVPRQGRDEGHEELRQCVALGRGVRLGEQRAEEQRCQAPDLVAVAQGRRRVPPALGVPRPAAQPLRDGLPQLRLQAGQALQGLPKLLGGLLAAGVPRRLRVLQATPQRLRLLLGLARPPAQLLRLGPGLLQLPPQLAHLGRPGRGRRARGLDLGVRRGALSACSPGLHPESLGLCPEGLGLCPEGFDLLTGLLANLARAPQVLADLQKLRLQSSDPLGQPRLVRVLSASRPRPEALAELRAAAKGDGQRAGGNAVLLLGQPGKPSADLAGLLAQAAVHRFQ
mmetsp:Transcript_83099/g.262536  ORF Transcript_83099/g.262536 Transcript_83099/m.262536 type:complete len:495 (+) Transcript_83099:1335-2819(+)